MKLVRDASSRVVWGATTLTALEMDWLPDAAGFRELINAKPVDQFSWSELVAAAGLRLDPTQTNKLDKVLRQRFTASPPQARNSPVRVAVVGSSTLDHLLPAIRVGGLRRGMWVEIHKGEYGQYLQDLMNEGSELYAFKPDVILFALDARHMFSGVDLAAGDAVGKKLDYLRTLWRIARDRLGAQVIQQTILPIYPTLVGGNEHRFSGSQAAFVRALNNAFIDAADESRVDILSLETVIQTDGLSQWYNPVLWHRAKQEISPAAAPAYGDLVARLLAARRGLSGKCLVLDLDNTLWGGVIGDDGLEGIQLGQGSALGEAYVEFQTYCLNLARRGVALAVCSKNDDANARAPFENHPDMVLHLDNIACFVANWQDKPSNLRHIAKSLNIGLESLVFADDNPFERNIVRRELPMVMTPELPEDPALYAGCIASAGYFDVVEVTREDIERSGQYQANLQRQAVMDQFTDMAGYLESLKMELISSPFDVVGLSRIVQLINKTNQFNLTTRRYDDADARAMMTDASFATFQFRLVDTLGDNGMICVVIGRIIGADTLHIDTWLMSCRVLGREVEREIMNVVARRAADLGLSSIVGEFIPTAKNDMVANHYRDLGFEPVDGNAVGASTWRLALAGYQPYQTKITVKES
jgi:FkbH-like protein